MKRDPILHEINLDNDPFDAMWKELNYSIVARPSDDFQVDDLIHVKESDMYQSPPAFSGREMIVQVMYITAQACVLSVVVLKRVNPSAGIFMPMMNTREMAYA